MKVIDIPQKIDDPITFLLWDIDEMAPIMLGLFIGVAIGKPLMMTVVGMLLSNGYSRYRDSKPEGFVLHYLYWTGFWPSSKRTTPNTYIRRFL